MEVTVPSGRAAITGPLPPGFLVLDPPFQPNQARRSGLQQSRAGPLQTPKEHVRCLQITLHKAVLNENRGVMPMSVYAQVSIGKNSLRTKTASYCGTSPVWNDVVQFGIKNRSPPKIKVEVFSWGLVSDDLVGSSDINVESVYGDDETGSRTMTGNFNIVALDCSQVGEVFLTVDVVGVERAADEERSPDIAAGSVSIQRQETPRSHEGNDTTRAEQIAIEKMTEKHQAANVAQLKESFPQFDEDLIKSVYIENGNDVQVAAMLLLQLDE
eukprot:CFRG6157T1